MNNDINDLTNKSDWPLTIEKTDIPGLLICKRETFEDERGFFREVIQIRDLEQVLDKKIEIKQWNHSSSKPSVIRGFHTEPWEKIIYVAKGNALCVIIDLRVESPTFGKTYKIEIGEKNKIALYLPKGMGNSFCNIGNENLEYMYLVTDYYKSGEKVPSVSLNDPIITNQFGGWPINNPIISEKDKNLPTLKEEFGSIVDLSKLPWLNS